MMGLIAACISVFSYAGYIIGIRKTRAVEVNSTVLTCYVMGLGALFFLLGGLFYDEGVRLETNVITWLYIGGLALPATAISNITLVKAVKLAGPTLTSLLGALEPLTAVLVGVFVFKELFTTYSALGIILVVISVSLVLFSKREHIHRRLLFSFQAVYRISACTEITMYCYRNGCNYQYNKNRGQEIPLCG